MVLSEGRHDEMLGAYGGTPFLVVVGGGGGGGGGGVR